MQALADRETWGFGWAYDGDKIVFAASPLMESLAKTFIRRDRESRASGGSRLPLNLWFVRVLQAVGVMNTAQTGGVLTREVLEAVFAEERFPDVILNNPKPRTIFTLLGNALGMMRYVIFG